jgi:hypothetical protein
MKQDYVLMPECKECGADLDFESYTDHEDIIIKIHPCKDCIQDQRDEYYDDGYDRGLKEGYDEGYDKGYDVGYEAGYDNCTEDNTNAPE